MRLWAVLLAVVLLLTACGDVSRDFLSGAPPTTVERQASPPLESTPPLQADFPDCIFRPGVVGGSTSTLEGVEIDFVLDSFDIGSIASFDWVVPTDIDVTLDLMVEVECWTTSGWERAWLAFPYQDPPEIAPASAEGEIDTVDLAPQRGDVIIPDFATPGTYRVAEDVAALDLIARDAVEEAIEVRSEFIVEVG